MSRADSFAGLESSGDSSDSTLVASADGSHVFGTGRGIFLYGFNGLG